jgi:4-oxalomesaconate tautomerase
VATACLLVGSPAASVYHETGSDVVRLEHPSGSMDATVTLTADDPPQVAAAGIVRTARMLMDGIVYPRSY